MDKTTNRINNFFKKDFKKKFITFISIPFMFSALFLADYFFFPEFNKTEKISQVSTIEVSGHHKFSSSNTTTKIGFNYITENNYKFSTTQEKRIIASEIKLKISPIYKTVKTVEIENKRIKLSSGLNGISGILFIICNSSTLISICYTLLTNKITENARLNLIFSNAFIFILWIIIIKIF
ncbi:hypothetical protein [Tenacibaculum sp.]|uniref:hypothetical protein n=1 Tax=Tenacibaculum sp. TaxID=1906242 RepID=UPI003D138B57